MTSCSAPRLLGVFPKEEAAFLAQMQTAVCSLQPAVTHAGTRKLLLCLDSVSPNPNLGKAALSSLSTRLCGWRTRRVGDRRCPMSAGARTKRKFRAGDHVLRLAGFLRPSGRGGCYSDLWTMVCLFLRSSQLMIFISSLQPTALLPEQQTCTASATSRLGSLLPLQGTAALLLA